MRASTLRRPMRKIPGRSQTLALCLSFVGLVSACSDPAGPAVPTTVEIIGIDTLASIGATGLLTAVVRDQRQQPMSDVAVTWESSAPGVVAVRDPGLVTARANGSATISARAGELIGFTELTVWQRVTSVVVTGPEQIGSGSTVQLMATARDVGGTEVIGRTIEWTSFYPTVVSIHPTRGVVTALGAGFAQVRSTVDGVFNVFQLVVVP